MIIMTLLLRLRKMIIKGWNWKEIDKCCPATPESDFADLYGTSDVRVMGKLVMRGGKVIDEGWYQKKLRRLKKGRRLVGGVGIK